MSEITSNSQPESTNTTNETDLIKRHKEERKELQSKIQSLKKSVTRGDRKKKKQISDEITKLEKELDDKHQSELAQIKSSQLLVNNSSNSCDGGGDIVTTDPMEVSEGGDGDVGDEAENDSITEEPADPNRRISRAQKRRNKKALLESEREKRISEQAERNKSGPRITETNTIKQTLRDLGLELYNIPADGNCLYCAINHQLEVNGKETFTVTKLRKLTAEFMREHKEEFIPFMYNEFEESSSEEYFENYCKEVASTKLWGGQLELRALSNIVKCPIKIIQANGPPTVQGENLKGPELILTYHRHLYRLGEHYNSTVLASGEDE